MVRLKIIVLGIAVWGLLGGYARAGNYNLPIAYVDLKYQLVRQGVDKNFVMKTFADPRNEFLPHVVRKIAYLRRERAADYSHFLKPEAVARGRSYIQEHRVNLNRAMNLYGILPEVIVAILTVETNLGNITGKYSVFNVFASLAVMDTPEVMAEADLDSRLKARLKKKAAWAGRELKIFLKYCQENGRDPYQFFGSWAGAMGYAQFLPSSLARCGKDGDGDGKVDLFKHADAIFSIANYLSRSGFRMDNQKTWRRAVLAYNPSDAYADTVLMLAAWY